MTSSFVSLPEDVFFSIIGQLDFLAAIRLIQTCKTLHTMTTTSTFWLLLRNKLERHCVVPPLNKQGIALDELRRGVASAWMLHDEWPLKNARWRTIPAIEAGNTVNVEHSLDKYLPWIVLFDDGVHILHTELDMTFKLRLLNTGEVLHSFPIKGDCSFLEYLVIDDGIIIVPTTIPTSGPGTLYVWHVPWSPTLNPRLLHEEDVFDDVCDNLAFGDLVGCVSVIPFTGELYIYLFNWKTSQDALIKVHGSFDHFRVTTASITLETLTILYACKPNAQFLAFDVKDVSSLLSAPTANVTLSPQYLFNISFHLTLTHHGVFSAILRSLWDNRLALVLRADGESSEGLREHTDSAVYAFLPFDADSLRCGADVGPLVAPDTFVCSFPTLISWENTDISMSGRSGKTRVFMTRPEDNGNQDTIRLCFFNLPGAKDSPSPPPQHYSTPRFDETNASTSPVDTLSASSIGKIFEVDVPRDILGDGAILAVEVGELTGTVAIMVEDRGIIIMECLPRLFEVAA